MIIKILGNKDSQAYKIAEACVREKGHRAVSYTHLTLPTSDLV